MVEPALAERITVLRGPAPGAWAWHADLHGRRTGDVPISGPAIDAAAVLQQFQLLTNRNRLGHIDNTAARTEGGAQGQSLGAVEAVLPDAPGDATALLLDWPWRAPAGSGQRLLDLQLASWRSPCAADPAPGGDASPQHEVGVQRQRWPVAALAGSRLTVAWPARAGWRSRWLVAELTAVDALGNRYRHAVSPSNPS